MTEYLYSDQTIYARPQ